MLQAATTNSSTFSSADSFHLREAFVQAGDLWRWLPGARIWAGERYYRRQDIHINDFFSVDMSGYGAGVEDLELGVGRLAIALIGSASDDVTTGRGAYSKLNLDVSPRSRHPDKRAFAHDLPPARPFVSRVRWPPLRSRPAGPNEQAKIGNEMCRLAPAGAPSALAPYGPDALVSSMRRAFSPLPRLNRSHEPCPKIEPPRPVFVPAP
jgi:hypothetical protein